MYIGVHYLCMQVLLTWQNLGACGCMPEACPAYHDSSLLPQAAGLREQRRVLGVDAVSMGRMLRLVADQTKRPCDKATGGPAQA